MGHKEIKVKYGILGILQDIVTDMCDFFLFLPLPLILLVAYVPIQLCLNYI